MSAAVRNSKLDNGRNGAAYNTVLFWPHLPRGYDSKSAIKVENNDNGNLTGGSQKVYAIKMLTLSSREKRSKVLKPVRHKNRETRVLYNHDFSKELLYRTVFWE